MDAALCEVQNNFSVLRINDQTFATAPRQARSQTVFLYISYSTFFVFLVMTSNYIYSHKQNSLSITHGMNIEETIRPGY